MSEAQQDVPALIRERLSSLAPLSLEIVDDSALHRGHAGAREGGHYRVKIVSSAFETVSTLGRHRMIHAALGDLMRKGIHAVSIETATPGEFRS